MRTASLMVRTMAVVCLCAPLQLLAEAPSTPTAPVAQPSVPSPPAATANHPGDNQKVCPKSKYAPTVLGLDTIKLSVVLAVLYWLANVIVRWNRIAHPTRELLRTQITSLTSELQLLNCSKLGVQKIEELLKRAWDLIEDQGIWRLKRAGDVLFWSRGQEIAGWGYVHEAQVQMAQFLPQATVVARLEAQERKLRTANEVSSVALADSIHRALTAATATDLDRLRALLAQACSDNYEREDESFAELVTWQNKTAWLVALGLLLIVLVVATFPERSVLLLAGAIGGLLSRLSRSLDRKDVPTDYGASWTTIFLSPVAGALGAWAGILLSQLAIQFHVLGTVFDCTWDDPYGPMTLAIALLFGFSERLLDTIFDKLVDKTTGSDASSGSSASRPPAALPAPASSGATSTTVASETLPDGTAGRDYSGLPPATGSQAALVWSLQDGALPDGLMLKTDGSLTGQPTAAAGGRTFNFSARGTGGGADQVRRFSIKIKPAG